MAHNRDRLHRREHGILAFSYRDEQDVWREKYTGTRDRVEARKFRKAFLEGLQKAILPTEMARWPMEVAEKWWIEFRMPRISDTTFNSEKYRLKDFRNFVGNKRLCEITNGDLNRYVNKRLSEGVGAWTINKEIQVWSLILKKAKLWHRLRDDYEPLSTKVSDIGRVVSREELQNLAKIAQGSEMWEAVFYGCVLAANTGLRGGEIKKLRIGAIDIQRCSLVVRRNSSKTDAGARHVELNRDATEAALRLLSRASLRDLVDFVQVTTGRQSDLASSIEDLARTVSEMTNPLPVGSRTKNPEGASLAKPWDSGILGLSSEVSRIARKLGILDDEIRRTDKLRQSCENVRSPLLAYANKILPLTADTNLQASDLNVLQQQKAELDGFIAVAKGLTPAIVALDKQEVLLASYISRLKSWRATVQDENEKTWRNLILRLIGAAAIVGALLLVGAAARQLADRHVHDTERRHVFRVIGRVAPWVMIVLVVAVSFTSDLTSLATFFGLLTAGVAIALQSVILSALGYFLLVGKRGIRVGDRVQISGITGDVTDIDWLQFQIREIDKKTQQPTGGVVAFPNSLVLSSGGLNKFNREDVRPNQLEVAGKSGGYKPTFPI